MMDAKNIGITKKIIHAGRGGGSLNYPKETKFIFHYQIRKVDYDRTILDDTRKYGRHMELYTGKNFQLEAWELCLETMLVGEVSSFVVEKQHLSSFPAINKKLRDYMTGRTERGEAKHCCGMMALQEQGGLGYSDLDELISNPQDLEFIFEMVKIELPEEQGQRESWLMNSAEKLSAVEPLREEGNTLYRDGHYAEATSKYMQAYGLVDQLMLMEKPGDEEWTALSQRRLPLLLNLAQCKLCMEEFYDTIRHASEALDIEPENVKALYRRGRAHAAVYNFEEARADFEAVDRLDPGMRRAVQRELVGMARVEKEKANEEKALFRGKLFTKAEEKELLEGRIFAGASGPS